MAQLDVVTLLLLIFSEYCYTFSLHCVAVSWFVDIRHESRAKPSLRGQSRMLVPRVTTVHRTADGAIFNEF